MATVIFQNFSSKKRSPQTKVTDTLERVISFLPSELGALILAETEKRSSEKIVLEEIRLRAERRVYLTVGTQAGKKNIPIAFFLSQDELARIFEKMCDGSLYAFGESIINGYISLGDGIRVGVCGRASLERGVIRGIYDISSLNVRLPTDFVALDGDLCDAIIRSIRSGGGVLIYSPPAQGKTTLLRSLCARLSSGEDPMRLAIVDSREELCTFACSSEIYADILRGYPKPQAIAMATAFMNPELIVCDEIGTSDEARAILDSQNCGVPLIASAHGENITSVLRRAPIRCLHDAGVFSLYVGIRISGRGGFEYVIHGKEEAEESIEAGGNSRNTFLRSGDR